MKPETLIKLDHVTLGYGKLPVLTDVSCTISRGECVGLVGPNGSGKTTFLKGVLGMLKPQAGVLHVNRAEHFAYVPQADELNVFWPLRVRDMVGLAVRSQRSFGRLTALETSRIQETLVQTACTGFAHRLFTEISGGQRQRAVIAQALAQKPTVLLLDEPTRGLDVVAEHDLLELIRSIQKKESLTVLFVTHSLHIPLNFTEKIFLLANGSLVVTDSSELVYTKRLEEIYGVPFLQMEKDGTRWVTPLRRV